MELAFRYLIALVCIVNASVIFSRDSIRHNDATDLRNATSGGSSNASTTSSNMTGLGNKTKMSGASATKTMMILTWTKKYGQNWKKLMPRGGRGLFDSCPYSACELTGDASRVDEADILLFFNLDKPNFPKVRDPRQLYVHVTRDPPRDPSQTYLDDYNNRINLTINYRRDSDFPQERFGFVSKQGQKSTDTAKYRPQTRLAQKTRSVVWVVSHCDVPSQRQQYVQELSKYIDVDIYGKCGNLTCPKSLGNLRCLQRFERQYKFYLSFENRFCRDYFTEKLMYPMSVELVPVVLGNADYDSFVPAHSVINAMDFKSPKQLAAHLHHVAGSESEYYKYFGWKAHYDLSPREPYFCYLCEVLHSDKYKRGTVQPSYKRSKEGNYRDWWQGACQHDLMEQMRERGNW